MKYNYFRFLVCLMMGCLLLAPEVTNAAPAKGKDSKYAKNKLDLYQIHNLSLWGGIGYSGMVNKHPMEYNLGVDGTSKFVGGAGGMLGVGYEWHYKKFMLSVGPEFRLLSSTDKLSYEDKYSIVGTDPASPYVLPGQIKYFDLQNMRENHAVGQIMLPVMVGGNWEETDIPMYFMAGVKVGYTVLKSYKQKADLETTLHDDMAMDPLWRNIRDLGTEKYISKGKNNFGLDVALSAEVGLTLDKYLPAEFQSENEDRRYPWHMRVALFMDYGLPLHTVGNPDIAMRTATESEMTTASFFDSYNESKVNSLLVGAKFTALLQLNRPKQMKPKNPYVVIHLINGRTNKPEQAEVSITRVSTGRALKKNANSKGMIVQRSAPGDYTVSVKKPGYLPVDPASITLVQDQNNDLKMKLDTTTFVLWPIPVFTCTIRDSKTGALIPATVSLIENHEDDSKPIAQLKQDVLKGSVSYELPMGQDYSALVNAENYQQQIYQIGVQDLYDINKEFTLDPIEKGRTYVIQNLFFASAETTILPQSEPSLQELFDYLNDNPEIRIRIVGHTDWVGTDRDNQILSEGRAKSVKQSMVDRGIDPSRIETEGKGESMPIDTNETEEGRQNNRRVEFTIL
ncbi:MAG: OmpA family protein [Paludibacteraceae bacterium]|nr:OmpA family protein [Paludibacteraceae bacterium]